MTDPQTMAGASGPASPQAAPRGRSLVDRIRERHENRDPTLDLPIPRWEGEVVVRFRRLSTKQLNAAARRRGARSSNATLLAAACQEVFLRDDDDGTLHPASEADGLAAPVRFDGRLADLFQLRAESPADIVLRMYADDVAIGAHAKRVFDWQTGQGLEELTLEEVEDDAGEEDAAT